MMKDHKFNVKITLFVRTFESVDTITQIMGVSPSKVIIDKNESVAVDDKSAGNIWALSRKYNRRINVDECLQHFVGQIPDYKKKIELLKQHGLCTIRISVISLLGQIGFSLCSEDIRLLHELGISMEVSIFSYGYCLE